MIGLPFSEGSPLTPRHAAERMRPTATIPPRGCPPRSTTTSAEQHAIDARTNRLPESTPS